MLGNEHFEVLFAEHFGVHRSFFAGKRILDIGCGPRGSLEWASDTSRRVGSDPLVDAYSEFGIDLHAIEYMADPVEHLSSAYGSFDVVSSLNSLDHVDDLATAMSEIARVLVPGGSFLLEGEFGHSPTPAEPIAIPPTSQHLWRQSSPSPRSTGSACRQDTRCTVHTPRRSRIASHGVKPQVCSSPT
ncbi:MAG: class I SAM-dependent methyltransferase [Actinomycetes bacterium]